MWKCHFHTKTLSNLTFFSQQSCLFGGSRLEGLHDVWQRRAACWDVSRSCLQDGRRGCLSLTKKNQQHFHLVAPTVCGPIPGFCGQRLAVGEWARPESEEWAGSSCLRAAEILHRHPHETTGQNAEQLGAYKYLWVWVTRGSHWFWSGRRREGFKLITWAFSNYASFLRVESFTYFQPQISQFNELLTEI